jgi:hypothetical protein
MVADPMTRPGGPIPETDAAPSPTELSRLLERSAGGAPPPHADGIAIAEVTGFTPGGLPVLRIAALRIETAATASLVALDARHVGHSVAVGFTGGNASMPIVLGLMLQAAPRPPAEARVDGERVVLQAEHEIELRCGEAAIVLSADGRITLRGTYITSHASATQRILGGSVNVN